MSHKLSIPAWHKPYSQALLETDPEILVKLLAATEKAVFEPLLELTANEENCGWRAADPGTQIVRLVFDEPQRLKRIWLVFEDAENTRTQEFVLRWSRGSGNSFREIVRQQWNVSPPDSVREVEDYSVDLSEVAVLELTIEPDKGDREARASLRSLRLA